MDTPPDATRPQRPPPALPPAPPGPTAAAGPAARPAAPRAVDLLAALGPLVPPHTEARLGIRVQRVRHLRFHDEYYGVYVQISHGGVLYEGHVSVLHCLGCALRLTQAQVRRVEARCRNLHGMTVALAHVPMVLAWWRGRVHRGWCTLHIQTALSRELWAVRGLLSEWIPAATSLENRGNFHISFDNIAV